MRRGPPPAPWILATRLPLPGADSYTMQSIPRRRRNRLTVSMDLISSPGGLTHRFLMSSDSNSIITIRMHVLSFNGMQENPVITDPDLFTKCTAADDVFDSR